LQREDQLRLGHRAGVLPEPGQSGQPGPGVGEDRQGRCGGRFRSLREPPHRQRRLVPREHQRLVADAQPAGDLRLYLGAAEHRLNSNGAFTGDQERRTWYDYKQLGVWQLGDSAEAAKYGSKPGQIRIQDTNGDGIINALDKVLQGNTYPKWTASIYNSFKFRSFDLSVLVNIRWGYTIWNTFLPSLFGRNGQLATSYWTPTNPDNVNPSPNLNGSPLAYGNSRGYIDGSNWRIRQVQFGYTLPPEMATRL